MSGYSLDNLASLHPYSRPLPRTNIQSKSFTILYSGIGCWDVLIRQPRVQSGSYSTNILQIGCTVQNDQYCTESEYLLLNQLQSILDALLQIVLVTVVQKAVLRGPNR